MLKSIHLKEFRAFRDVTIGPFNRVNLIAGLNNTSKTSLLEAIFLSLTDTEAQKLPTLFRTFSQGADINESFWPWLITDKNRNHDVTIEITDDQSRAESVLLSFKSHGDGGSDDSDG